MKTKHSAGNFKNLNRLYLCSKYIKKTPNNKYIHIYAHIKSGSNEDIEDTKWFSPCIGSLMSNSWIISSFQDHSTFHFRKAFNWRDLLMINKIVVFLSSSQPEVNNRGIKKGISKSKLKSKLKPGDITLLREKFTTLNKNWNIIKIINTF